MYKFAKKWCGMMNFFLQTICKKKILGLVMVGDYKFLSWLLYLCLYFSVKKMVFYMGTF